MSRPTVLLRQWKGSDLAPYAAMNADPEVMRHFPRPLSRGESRGYMERCREGIHERGWGLWAIDMDGEFAGFAGLARPGFTSHFTPCVEIGWRLRREFWGRGVAYAAALEAERIAFEELRLPRLVSFTAVGNLRSRRLMERLGFTSDANEDFPHPLLPLESPLLRHVLYRKNNPLH
jgi:RimJ/RimL family protein N-acetyltransferase